MPITNELYKVLQSQATLDQTRAATEETQATAAVRRDALQTQMMLRAASPQMFGQLFNNQTGPGSATPTAGGQPPVEDDSEVGQAKRRIGALDTQAQQMENFARVLGSIDPKQGMQAVQQAVELRKAAATEGMGLLRQYDDNFKLIGGIAGSVVPGDAASLARADKQIAIVDPRALRVASFDRDPNGSILPTERNYAKMKGLEQSSIQGAQRANIQHQIAEEGLRQQDIGQRASDNEESRALRREELAARNAAAAAAQAGVQQRHEENIEQRRENTRLSAGRLAEEVGKKYMDVSKDFSEIKPAFITADRYLFDENGNKTPSGDKTGASDLMLRDSYLKVVHPYFKGSVYELKDIEKLSGLPSRVLQGLKSLTEGKELSESVRYDMYDAMKSKFKVLNEQQIQQEDAARKRLTAANADPGMINAWVPGYALRSGGKTLSGAPAPESAPAQQPLTATNPATGARMKSLDGGKTWQPM